MPFVWTGACKHCGNALKAQAVFPAAVVAKCDGCGWERTVTAAELEQNPVAVWKQTPDREFAEALCIAIEEANIQLDALNIGNTQGQLNEVEAVLSKYVDWTFDMDPGTGGLARRSEGGESDDGAEAAAAN